LMVDQPTGYPTLGHLPIRHTATELDNSTLHPFRKSNVTSKDASTEGGDEREGGEDGRDVVWEAVG
jgi:hypothetical protein